MKRLFTIFKFSTSLILLLLFILPENTINEIKVVFSESLSQNAFPVLKGSTIAIKVFELQQKFMDKKGLAKIGKNLNSIFHQVTTLLHG